MSTYATFPRCGFVLLTFFVVTSSLKTTYPSLSSQATEIFLTHDWANDELGRSNHERVKRVYQHLVEIGVSACFDETVMRGDINHTVSLK